MAKVYSYFKRPSKIGLKFLDKSRTQQQFKEESDINVIVKKFCNVEGFVDPSVPRRRTPVYGDFSNVQDFSFYMNEVNKVNDIFAGLPSDIRARFMNNPALFAEFASKDENLKALADIGVIEPFEKKVIENVNTSVDNSGVKDNNVSDKND